MSLQPLTPDIREELITRLKRVEGQARGIQKMIQEERSCDEIITQIAALKAGATQAAALILLNYMEKCLMKESEGAAHQGMSREAMAKILGKLL
jgi:DNA-binding FrmR family transcriptional regulator